MLREFFLLFEMKIEIEVDTWKILDLLSQLIVNS